MRLEMEAWDLVGLENGLQEHLGTFSSHRKAMVYGNYLITTGQEVCWANATRDGLSVSGPYILRINPVFKQEKK
jgi:hypothetical protein